MVWATASTELNREHDQTGIRSTRLTKIYSALQITLQITVLFAVIL